MIIAAPPLVCQTIVQNSMSLIFMLVRFHLKHKVSEYVLDILHSVEI